MCSLFPVMDCVFMPHAQCSRDRLQSVHDPVKKEKKLTTYVQ